MKISLYFVLLLIPLLSLDIIAQTNNVKSNTFGNNWEVNYNIGFSQFYGDASSSGFFQKFSGELGIGNSLHIKKHIIPAFAVGINAYYGCANSHKTSSSSGSVVDFSLGGGYGDINIRAYLNFNSLFLGYNPNRKLSFYGWLGLGYGFWSTGLTDNFTSGYRESGDAVAGTAETYKKGGGVVPFGFGVDYRITNKWSVNVVGDYRTILNDDLDVWRGGFKFDNLFFVGIGVSYHIKSGFGKRRTMTRKAAPPRKVKEKEDVEQKEDVKTSKQENKLISDIPVYEFDYSTLTVKKERVKEKPVLEVLEIETDPISNIAGMVYRVQILAKGQRLTDVNYLRNKYNLTDDVFEVYQDGVYRYSVGAFSNYTKATEYLRKIKNMGINDAFVVVYQDGKRIKLTSKLK